jgi:isoleucyl-tRNA synthetase
LSNLYDFDPAKQSVPVEQLTSLDRWALGEFARLEADVAAAYEAFEFHAVYQKIAQFVTVELSSVYHDIIKDRMYTDAAGSLRRRSTQTVLHRIVIGLCQMLSPILAFTSDETWESIPGKPTESVHLSDWSPAGDPRTEGEKEAWRVLFSLREQVLPVIEKARQAKTLGKALEARLTVVLEPAPAAVAAAQAAELKEILNVSQLVVESGAAFEVRVERARGVKCERCWHWEEDVGQCAEHPTLCGRCAAAVMVS